MARAGTARSARPVEYVEVPTNPVYWIPERVEMISGRDEFVERLLQSDPGPRAAFVEGEAVIPAPCSVTSVEERSASLRLEVDCSASSFLVASVTPHKYWSATIDGEQVPILRVNVGYSGLELREGAQVVEMRYSNPMVAGGAAITLLAILCSAAVIWRPGSFG